MLGDKVCVMGIPYKVRKIKRPDNVDIHRNERLTGQIDFVSNTISIYWGEHHSKEEIEDTVLHEIMHAVIYGLFRMRKDIDYDTLISESIIDPLSTALRDTLSRNNLVKWKIVD